MDISNVAATPVSAIASSPQQSAPKNEKQSLRQDNSAVVKLSAQARQLSRAENVDTVRAEIKPKEMAVPPGIQFLKGESKGGQVNTYA